MKRWRMLTAAMLMLGLSLGVSINTYGEVRESSNGDKVEGRWISDKQQGPGTIYYKNGNRFEGFWRDGSLEGTGICYKTDGSREFYSYYDGQANGLAIIMDKNGKVTKAGILEDHEWKDDAETVSWTSSGTQYFARQKADIDNGRAIAVYSTGEVYIGEFKNRLRNGWGTFFYAEDGWHMGYWKDDVEDGAGFMFYSSNSDVMYIMGSWKDGDRQATIQYYRDDSLLIANHKDDKADGPGVLIKSDGNAIFCEYKDGEISNDSPKITSDNDGCRFIGETDGTNGYGLRLMKNGQVFIGELKDKEPEGYGVNYWPESGNLYEGEYKAGDRTEGMYIKPNGTTYKGTFWEDTGKDKTGTYRDFRKSETGTTADDKMNDGTITRFKKDGSTVIEKYKDGNKQN